MNHIIKPLLIMLFGLFATSCNDETITPGFKPFESWEQSGIGKTWFYQYQNEFITTSGGQQSKLITNPTSTPKGKHILVIEVDNRSLAEDVKIYVYASFKDRSEGQGAITPMPGKVSYSVDITLYESAKIGFMVVGDSFNLDILSIRYE